MRLNGAGTTRAAKLRCAFAAAAAIAYNVQRFEDKRASEVSMRAGKQETPSSAAARVRSCAAPLLAAARCVSIE